MVERANRTVSVKVQGHSAEEILAIFKALEKVLPGVQITSGIKPSSFQSGNRFDYPYYSFALVSFELTPDGNARPTQRNAVLAFEEGREP